MAGTPLTREEPVTARDIERAARRIADVVRETPVLSAGEITRRIGAPVTLKAESLQRTGSFKLRGATNKLSRLSKAELEAGVVAASAGNHAQAVAVAARQRGSEADLFIPVGAPLAKAAAVRSYGGIVHPIDGSFDEAAEEARAFAHRNRKTLIPAFDDPHIVAGAGTVGLEIARQAPRTRLVAVPLGGGGLIAGVAIALKWLLPEVRVIGVQAEGFAPYLTASERHRPIGTRSVNTISDGIAIKRAGEFTRPLVERWVDEVVTVSDDQVAEAMVLLLERTKLVVEGAGAASVAALLAGNLEPPASGETCAILSGGNVDASRLVECIRLGETVAERRLAFATVIPDRPGALAGLLRIVAEHDANVVDVMHVREGVDLHVGETAVRLVVQTKGPEHSQRITEAIEAEGFVTRPG
jgi:threonine dehydratase